MKFWLSTMSVGDPATKRQLPFGSFIIIHKIRRIQQPISSESKRDSELLLILRMDKKIIIIQKINIIT